LGVALGVALGVVLGVEQGRGSGEGGIGGDAGGEAKAGGGGASNKATKTSVRTEQQRNVENQANHSTHNDMDTRGANGLSPYRGEVGQQNRPHRWYHKRDKLRLRGSVVGPKWGRGVAIAAQKQMGREHHRSGDTDASR
jgi:hypothetical protein